MGAKPTEPYESKSDGGQTYKTLQVKDFEDNDYKLPTENRAVQRMDWNINCHYYTLHRYLWPL
jgi:hypothetical protein